MADARVQLDSFQVGELFAQAVTDVKRSVPPGITGAIDIALDFKSIKVAERGLSFVFTNKTENQSSVELKLATRIYTDAPSVSQKAMIDFLQESLKKDGITTVLIPGEAGLVFQNAVLAAADKVNIKNQLQRWGTQISDDTLRTGYLQHALNRYLVDAIIVDGLHGARTEKALVSVIGLPR